jgi:FkbM family methyltransferase
MNYTNWRDAARAFKKAFLTSVTRNRFAIDVVNEKYQVCYESRVYVPERDYEMLRFFAREKKCIFDIGANHGITALMMARQCSLDGLVYAFDPSEEACRIIQENALHSHMQEKVIAVNSLVMDHSGDVQNFYWSFASGGASIFENRLGHNYALKKVTLSVDDFCLYMKLKPDLIKIDVEGAEFLVIKGMENTLRSDRPMIHLELHSWQEMTMKANAKQILEWLIPFGYHMIYLSTLEIITDPNLLSARGRCHVLLKHQDSPLPSGIELIDRSGI